MKYYHPLPIHCGQPYVQNTISFLFSVFFSFFFNVHEKLLGTSRERNAVHDIINLNVIICSFYSENKRLLVVLLMRVFVRTVIMYVLYAVQLKRDRGTFFGY